MDMTKFEQRRMVFENMTRQYKSLYEQDLCMTLNDEKVLVCLFDWFELFLQQSNGDHTYAQDVDDYHIPVSTRSQFEALDLIPIAVLGFRSVHDLASMTDVGTVMLDLSKASAEDAPILFFSGMAVESEDGVAGEFQPTLNGFLASLRPED